MGGGGQKAKPSLLHSLERITGEERERWAFFKKRRGEEEGGIHRSFLSSVPCSEIPFALEERRWRNPHHLVLPCLHSRPPPPFLHRCWLIIDFAIRKRREGKGQSHRVHGQEEGSDFGRKWKRAGGKTRPERQQQASYSPADRESPFEATN